jgi:hypothetical protein
MLVIDIYTGEKFMPRLTAYYFDRTRQLPPAAANDVPVTAVDQIISLAVIAAREPTEPPGERDTTAAPSDGLRILDLVPRLRRHRRNMSLEQIARALSLR